MADKQPKTASLLLVEELEKETHSSKQEPLEANAKLRFFIPMFSNLSAREVAYLERVKRRKGEQAAVRVQLKLMFSFDDPHTQFMRYLYSQREDDGKSPFKITAGVAKQDESLISEEEASTFNSKVPAFFDEQFEAA